MSDGITNDMKCDYCGKTDSVMYCFTEQCEDAATTSGYKKFYLCRSCWQRRKQQQERE